MNYDAKIDTADGQAGAAPFDPLDDDDDGDRLSKRRIAIIGVIAILVLIALSYAVNRSKPTALDSATTNQAPVVSVITAKRTTVAGQINATGTLAARREMPVGSVGEGGQVVQVLVEPGEWVRAGQALAVIDRSVQTQQQASLAAQVSVAAADARLAQANLDRALKLVDRGFISKADIDRLTATRDAANARVRVANAQLGEKNALTRRLNIVAPAAGLVLERNVEPGQVVSGGSGVLFRIAKDGQMEMLARLTEDDLAQLSAGVSAEVTPVGSARSFAGQVWQVSPVIDPQNRQGTVRIALPYAPEIRPGGFASVEIAAGSTVAPLLPESAILSDNDGSFVYIVDKDNKVRRRTIKAGAITDNGIIVTAGLSGNERVVARAGAFVSTGETVKPKMAQTP
jgi:HlyD family secretion protein